MALPLVVGIGIFEVVVACVALCVASYVLHRSFKRKLDEVDSPKKTKKEKLKDIQDFLEDVLSDDTRGLVSILRKLNEDNIDSFIEQAKQIRDGEETLSDKQIIQLLRGINL